MFDIYARSFLEASRFTPHTRPDPHTQTKLDAAAERRQRHFWLWQRRPYWS